LPGRVEAYLLKALGEEGALHLLLIDPEKPGDVAGVAKAAQEAGTAAFLVGGSTAVATPQYVDVTDRLKRNAELPVIIFPCNLPSIAPGADAILFMSLLNSSTPYFIVGAQALGIPLIRRMGLEAIPTAYIVIGEGGSVGFVGEARAIPVEHPELAAMYSMAAEAFGFRLIYLEGGSGVRNPLPAKLVSTVRRAVNTPLMVGGGVRTGAQAQEAAAAGADIIVTGNVIEETGDPSRLAELVAGAKRGGRERAGR